MSADPSGHVHPEVGSDEAREWHRIAEQRRQQLERMQDSLLYGLAAAALAAARRVVRLVRTVVEPAFETMALVGRSVLALPKRSVSGRHERLLRDRLARLGRPSDAAGQRSDVTAVIVTATQAASLDGLLRALGRIGVSAVVVDNAGEPEIEEVVGRHPGARRIALAVSRSYSAANEVGIAEVETPWVLLLNDDVAPLDDTWLDRMLDAADDRTVAVGALLVHGRRGLLGGRAIDGTVQHAGVGFVLDGALPRPVHLGRGSVPVPADATREVPAATAACLLVRTEVHRRVGGFHPGFDYGSEDVDLCLRLAEHGTIRVAMGAVLHHEEGATRLSRRGRPSRAERAGRRAANGRLLDGRHGPKLRRRIVEAAFDGAVPTLCGEVVVGVVGSEPRLLHQAVAGLPAVHLRPGGAGALMVVTDPRRVPDGRRGAAHRQVPVVGWLLAGTSAEGWTDEVVGRLDALVVEEDVTAQQHARWVESATHVRQAGTADDALRAVRGALLADRWSVRIGAGSGRRAQRWGDVPVGREIVDELRRAGVVARLMPRDRWGSEVDRAADVTLHLKGRGVAPMADAQRNVIWVISHPSEVAPDELDAADLVVAGSRVLADRYRVTTRTAVEVLPQAAARRFTSAVADPDLASRVLFVGNTRSVPRPAVLGAVAEGLPLTLIGEGWERYLDPSLVRAKHVPFEALPRWYASAEVVLNDHWEDMARWGLVSNRVFDALAAGACVVSDDVAGWEDGLSDVVVTFRDRDGLGAAVRGLLEDAEHRQERARRGRREVIESHTWAHRVADLLRMVRSLTTAEGAP